MTYCYCASGYYFDEYTQICTQQKSEGMVCYVSGQCVDNSTCVNNVCSCYPGYWSNPRTGQCDPTLNLNDTCIGNVTYVPCNNEIYGLNCFNRTCGCDPVYEYWDPVGLICSPRHQYLENYGIWIIGCNPSNQINLGVGYCAAWKGLTCNSWCSNQWNNGAVACCGCASGLGWSGTYYACV